MPCTPYMHTIKHIHCHCKQRDVKRRHRQLVVPAPGTAAEQPTLDAVDDDDDDGPFVSKIRGATFQRRLPRTYGQCTHPLRTNDEENNKLQGTLLDFVACFCHFGVLGERTQSPSSRILLTKHPSHPTRKSAGLPASVC